MKDNFTSINVIIDRSGSMSPLTKDTIGGFNTFLKEQQAVKGEAVFTLAMFDHEYELVHDCVPIADVPELDETSYVPRGSTALLDAIGRTIIATGAKLSAMKEEDRPSKVVFVIISDGQENCSREMKKANIMEMVKQQTEVYSWQFIYLNADLNAIAEAGSMGFNLGSNASFSYSSHRMPGLFASISDSMTNSRTTGQVMSINQKDLVDNTASTTEPASTSDTK